MHHVAIIAPYRFKKCYIFMYLEFTYPKLNHGTYRNINDDSNITGNSITFKNTFCNTTQLCYCIDRHADNIF